MNSNKNTPEMLIDSDVPITMDDGLVLRADIFRPDDNGQYPVIMASSREAVCGIHD